MSRKNAKLMRMKFTGRKVDKVLEIDIPSPPSNNGFPKPQKNVAILGRLIELGKEDGGKLEFKPPYPILCSDGEGRHLYVSGRINGDDEEFEAEYIVYKIRKVEDKGKQDYIHHFEFPKPKIMKKGGEIFISDTNFHVEGRGIVG